MVQHNYRTLYGKQNLGDTDNSIPVPGRTKVNQADIKEKIVSSLVETLAERENGDDFRVIRY
jgi:hypothetical protein